MSNANYSDWQADAMSIYRRWQERAHSRLRAELPARIFALTGQVIPPAAVYVDDDARLAMAVVDGVRFRLQHQKLVVVAMRPLRNR